MHDDPVARRYAAALFAKAVAMGQVDAIEGDLRSIADNMRTLPNLRMLSQPLLTDTLKKQMMKSVFGTQIQPITLHFLNLLVDKRRLDTLNYISTIFTDLMRTHRNVALATATSATPLTEQQIAALKKAFEERTGKTIQLQTETDPSLIGGVLVRIGDTVYDGTVKGSLERLREQLLQRR